VPAGEFPACVFGAGELWGGLWLACAAGELVVETGVDVAGGLAVDDAGCCAAFAVQSTEENRSTPNRVVLILDLSRGNS
jgi:hypothetical protein